MTPIFYFLKLRKLDRDPLIQFIVVKTKELEAVINIVVLIINNRLAWNHASYHEVIEKLIKRLKKLKRANVPSKSPSSVFYYVLSS